MNFAIISKKPEPCCVSESSDKPSYPEICLRDELVDKFKELVGGKLEMGMEIALDAPKFKVKGMREDQYGKSIDLCLVECEGATSESVEGEDAEKLPLKDRLKNAPAKKSIKDKIREADDEEGDEYD